LALLSSFMPLEKGGKKKGPEVVGWGKKKKHGKKGAVSPAVKPREKKRGGPSFHISPKKSRQKPRRTRKGGHRSDIEPRETSL